MLRAVIKPNETNNSFAYVSATFSYGNIYSLVGWAYFHHLVCEEVDRQMEHGENKQSRQIFSEKLGNTGALLQRLQSCPNFSSLVIPINCVFTINSAPTIDESVKIVLQEANEVIKKRSGLFTAPFSMASLTTLKALLSSTAKEHSIFFFRHND